MQLLEANMIFQGEYTEYMILAKILCLKISEGAIYKLCLYFSSLKYAFIAGEHCDPATMEWTKRTLKVNSYKNSLHLQILA